MRSSYRFAAPVIVRLLGVGVAGLGLVVLVWVALAVVLSAPEGVLTAGFVVVLLGLVAFLGLVLVLRRGSVVRFDERGFRIRFVRGAGVRQAEWRQVEDVAAATVAGERCVVLRLRDGRTASVPVGVLAGRTEDFVEDLRAHLDEGQGYRPLPRG